MLFVVKMLGIGNKRVVGEFGIFMFFEKKVVVEDLGIIVEIIKLGGVFLMEELDIWIL